MPVRTQTDEKGVAELIIDHPPVNALDGAGWRELAAGMRALGDDPAVRVVIMRAEGKGFCAGVDIKELARDSAAIIEVRTNTMSL